MKRRNLYYILRQDLERNQLSRKRQQAMLLVLKNHGSSLTNQVQKNIMTKEEERR